MVELQVSTRNNRAIEIQHRSKCHCLWFGVSGKESCFKRGGDSWVEKI